MKICSKCKLKLLREQFNRRALSKDGLRSQCRNCDRDYYATNKEEVAIQKKEYYNVNKEEIATIKKIYNEAHKEEIAIYQKDYYEINKEEKAIYNKNWREANKEELTIKKTDYERERLQFDLQFKLVKNLRSRLYRALNHNFKTGSAIADLGCTVEEFKKYLESSFYPNSKTGEAMSWDNYGLKGWHIDHIKPLSSFDLMDRNQLLKACHFTNLQPLWAEENLKKSDKWNEVE